MREETNDEMFRYHFEGNKEQYFPTITFSNGHAEVLVTWPNAVDKLPSIDEVIHSSLSFR